MAFHKFQKAKPRSPHPLWPLITGGCQGADGGASGICRSSPWKGMTSCRAERAQKAATKQLPSGSKGLENTQLCHHWEGTNDSKSVNTALSNLPGLTQV